MPSLGFYPKPQRVNLSMTVISEWLGLVRVLGRRKNGLAQHLLVGEANTEDRLENSRLVPALPMSRVQHIILDLCAEIGAGTVWELHRLWVCQTA